MRVSKEFKFHAAHRDEEAADQCGRLHGHTYRIELWVEGHCGSRDMLLHGDILKAIYRDRIEPSCEHQYLNETLPFNPTMENVLRWAVTELVKELRARRTDGDADHEGKHWFTCGVRLYETPTMYAEAEETI